MKLFLLSLFSTLTMFSCAAQNKKTLPTKSKTAIKSKKTSISTKNLKENTNKLQNTILFKEGENKFLKEYEMNVTFENTKEDSRCPKNADCVWQGVATVDITLMGTFTRPLKIQLSTTEDQKKGLTDSAIFNGYKITLLDVKPYPVSSKNFKENTGNHEILLQFIKIAENQIEPNTR